MNVGWDLFNAFIFQCFSTICTNQTWELTNLGHTHIAICNTSKVELIKPHWWAGAELENRDWSAEKPV